MKIAILGSRGYPYVYSGYETFVSELVPRLTAKGHELTVYCHSQLFTDRPKEVNGVKLVYIPAIEHKILSQFSHSFLSTLHVMFRGFDVILYVNSANGPFGLFTMAAFKKTAINVDGLEWMRPKWKGLGAKYFHFSSLLSTKLFTKVITDSDRMHDIYKKEFNSESEVIAYGATPEFSEKPELVSHFGVKPGDYYLIVGRLIPDNNSDIIVKGFEKSSTTRKLVILGDVPYKDEFADRVKSTTDNRIIFPGYVKDKQILKELYANCYAYLHGHEFGGTNPTLLKALAYGNCILALDTVFSREVLLNDKHGLYFSKNPESVTEVIDFIDKNEPEAEKFRKISRERITSHYTWEKITDQYEKLFISMK